jgi:ABC-2 type transport system permease protein
MLGAIGLALSATIRQLENFAGIMNFVIFPMFFLSSALYPLWRMRESSELIFWICTMNPFTYAVELLRHTLYLKLNTQALIITASCLVLIFTFAAWRYNASRLSARPTTGGISKGD